MFSVTVTMATHNHEKYIAEAIESVVMQITSFPVTLYIGEDCSSDRTREICISYKERYPERIDLVLHPRNIGTKANFTHILEAWERSSAKYIALLEGDDFWTDPDKLQKQVNFLEANPDCALVHTDLDLLYENSGLTETSCHREKTIPQGDVYEELLCGNFIYTPTVVASRRVIVDAFRAIDFAHKNWLMGDYPVWLEISRHHKVGYISEVTATYRVRRDSASHPTSHVQGFLFGKSTFDFVSYFIDRYGCSEKTKRDIDFQYHLFLLKSAFRLGDYRLASTAWSFFKRKKVRIRQKERYLIPLCSNSYIFILGKVAYVVFRMMRWGYVKVAGAKPKPLSATINGG